ncbi:phosphotransferase [Bifidobacterium aquikefiri]|uniref:phosphotransferase n=1 Tax=Bifidobacterium aquikefiri TaxID=1653207 RepID=UPI0023EF6714|nr:phosphotransferase [Bifidobacterium aquikefiri]
MTTESNLTLAALASATMPNIAMSGISDGEQLAAQDIAAGIRTAVIRDTSGHLYDVIAAARQQGKKLLKSQVRAALALSRARETAGLGFSIERIVSFEAGDDKEASTGTTGVVMAAHCDGHPRKLSALTIDECMAVGTAIGAIHRMRPNFLKDESYPCYSTDQIHQQLTGWIRTLSKAGHIPREITSSWAQIVETEGLWSFSTCTVHGGFHDGDIIFNGSNLTGIHRWQNMQMNDPARDLAWIFAKLDEEHRNALLSSYGRMMGSRLDSLIMLRANLWLQMETVSDLIQALDSANNDAIVTFRAEVERLAHQIAMKHVDIQKVPAHRDPNAGAPSTITVGSLLASGDDSDASRHEARHAYKGDESSRPANINGISGSTGTTGQEHHPTPNHAVVSPEDSLRDKSAAPQAPESTRHSDNAGTSQSVDSANRLGDHNDLNMDDHPTEVVQAAEVANRHQQEQETIVIPVQKLHDAVGEHNQTKDNS